MTTVVLSAPSSSSSSASPSLAAASVDVSSGKGNKSSNVGCHSSSNQKSQEINQRDRETAAITTTELRNGARKKRPRVVFEEAEIVEFEPTVHTTSVTSGGVPVGMSLKERSRVRRRLDSFEMERKNCRVGRQNYMEEGYLDPEEREFILNNAGCEEEIISKVEEEVNRIIAHRRESNEIDFEYLCGLGGMSVELEEEDDEDDDIDEEINVAADLEEDEDTKCYDSSLDDSIVNELLEQEEQIVREREPEQDSERESTAVLEVLVTKPKPKPKQSVVAIQPESVISPV